MVSYGQLPEDDLEAVCVLILVVVEDGLVHEDGDTFINEVSGS